ncbi:MAG: flippase-like domain-containing protein [Candidatus Omnitrophica bacterium]|nr:flippase-like domain-containing protein [Candidatus Omnitrophota bacterium]
MMKRLVALGVTVVLLFLIFRVIDLRLFLQALAHPRWPELVTAFFLFIPLITITSLRWQILVHKSCHSSFWEATRIQLASNALNLILPSKLGDLSKGLFLRNTGKVDLSRGMNIVVFEKMVDLSCLGIVYLTGWIATLSNSGYKAMTRNADWICIPFMLFVLTLTAMIYFIPLRGVPGYTWMIGRTQTNNFFKKIGYFIEDGQKLMALIRENNAQILSILFLSLALWFLHMTQVFLFFRAVDVSVGLFTTYHVAPIAILAGLIPISLFGVGVRDGSILVLFSDYGPPAVLFAASTLITLRYIIPGLAGSFFVNRYLIQETRNLSKV